MEQPLAPYMAWLARLTPRAASATGVIESTCAYRGAGVGRRHLCSEENLKTKLSLP